MRAGLAASTVTPGRTAPVVSLTTPAMLLLLWAWVGEGRNTSTAKATTTDGSVFRTLDLLGNRCRFWCGYRSREMGDSQTSKCRRSPDPGIRILNSSWWIERQTASRPVAMTVCFDFHHPVHLPVPF